MWLIVEVLIAVAIFFCLAAASIGSLFFYPRMQARHRDDETAAVVRLVANIFVVVSSLMLSLMLNSAKNTYSEIDRNIHAYATDIILLDRHLRSYGMETAAARQQITAYVRRAVGPSDGENTTLVANRTSEGILRSVSLDLEALEPANEGQRRQLETALAQLHELVELRWVLVEQSEGTIPAPLIVLLVAWLTLILASFGYRAPRNIVVVSSFVIASALLSAAIYLILDMDVPFAGPIQVSDLPLRRALAELELP